MLGFVAGAAVLFGPGAIGLTKLVDGIRSFDSGDTWPKGLWIGIAFVIGIVACVAFQIDVVGGLLNQVPALADKTISPTVGQVLTGIAFAGTASYHHEKMDRASQQASEAEAAANRM